MIKKNVFKNSPLHDKNAIIELMDKLNPEEMVKVVDLLLKLIENKKIDIEEKEMFEKNIAVVCLDAQDFQVWKAINGFGAKEFESDNYKNFKIGNKKYFCITKISDLCSIKFEKFYVSEYGRLNPFFYEIYNYLKFLNSIN